MLRFCLECGALTHLGSRCAACHLLRVRIRSRLRGTRQQQGYGAEWQRIRLMILERDDYTCQLHRHGCTIIATTVDHVIPLSRGGTDDETNLVAACLHCNSSKKNY